MPHQNVEYLPRDQGIRLPPSNNLTHHPIREHIERHQHTVGPAIVNPPLTLCVRRRRATSELLPDLCRAQSLPYELLLPIPTTGENLRNPQHQRSHRVVPLTNPYTIGYTSEYTEACDAGPGFIRGGKGPPLQVRNWVFS